MSKSTDLVLRFETNVGRIWRFIIVSKEAWFFGCFESGEFFFGRFRCSPTSGGSPSTSEAPTPSSEATKPASGTSTPTSGKSTPTSKASTSTLEGYGASSAPKIKLDADCFA
ncbi:unnamed protein product [Caenorhabditis nigoni]